MRNIKVILLGGEPASGKTTVFKCVRDVLFPAPKRFKHKTACGVVDGRFIMLGVFDGSTFEGTDKLSMSVINDALELLEMLDAQPERRVVFVEGDRLFCRRFINSTSAEVYILQTDCEILRNRRECRKKQGISQPEAFYISRRSKIQSIANLYGLSFSANNTLSDSAQIASRLIASGERWVNGQD